MEEQNKDLFLSSRVNRQYTLKKKTSKTYSSTFKFIAQSEKCNGIKKLPINEWLTTYSGTTSGQLVVVFN